jgi:iron complex outermembrane recepter protein
MRVRARRLLSRGAFLAATLGARLGLAQTVGVTMPEVIERFDAEYPVDAANSAPVTVVLFVAIDVHGHVTAADVAGSGGADFDNSARTAVAHWRFSPALRDGRPVPVRIRVPFVFPPRSTPAAEPGATQPATAEPGAAQSETTSPTKTTLLVDQAGGGRSSEEPAALAAAPGAESAGLKAASAAARPANDASTRGGETRPGVQATGSNVPPVPATAEVIVQGHYRPPSRGAGDFHIDVGQLSRVPRKSAADMLQLAPGILLTNEGGEGHAQQVFLRGFDAREGQDIEFTVGGVPINEAGNLHGNGHADANFIIPETVLSLRVLEGPFDPRQGDFAVAGSADYRLGLERRGLTLKSTLGSYGTERLLGLWGPTGLSRCTFGAAEIYKTDGFGQNRDAQRASAVAQYEGKFGDTGSYRVTAQGYSANYHSAGVLRDDDYRAGRVGFFDTYDRRQGGDSSRYSIAADVEQSVKDTLFREQLYIIRRDMRIRSNFTGYLLDVQEPAQLPHSQRGDGIDLSVDSWTIGSRGSSRVTETIGGLKQELEVGYLARGDFGRGVQLRLQSSNGVPYHRDIDVEYALGDMGLYGDANLRLLSWLMLRGGLRANFFAYNVLNNCAQQSVRQPSRSDPPGDASCLDQQDFGYYRDPTQRSSTATTTLMPRASVLFAPASGLVLSMSYGQGVRSIDPIYISQDLKTPFARVNAYEAGVVYSRTLSNSQLVTRAAAFRTHVAQDLIFSETAGRNTLANGTTRNGFLAATRFTGAFFDQSLNVTLVQSRFDDTGLAIPYVPNWVVRSDTVLHRELPFRLAGSAFKGAAGAGVTYVGKRPLPYNQLSDPVFTIDASATLEWRRFEVGFEVTNLLDNRYRLGEYNYASNFPTGGATEQPPTLVPVRHFSAGPPRMFFMTLAVTFGEQT